MRRGRESPVQTSGAALAAASRSDSQSRVLTIQMSSGVYVMHTLSMGCHDGLACDDGGILDDEGIKIASC